MSKLLYILLLIRIFTPIVKALIVDRDTKIAETPEYSEYLRQVNTTKITPFTTPTIRQDTELVETTKTSILTPISTSIRHDRELVEAPLPAPFNHLPGIQLCKEKPADGDLYGQIFCWGMFALYMMLIISLIIYQLRSFFWIKNTIKQQENSSIHSQSRQVNIELGPYEQRTTY